MTEPIPVTLGRYVILEEIGRGMMGAVYRAADPDLGRVVALKTVRLAFAASEQEREQFEHRFLAEARAAGGLSHRGIVVVHDVGRDLEAGALFIALEFLEGRTLDRLISDKPLEWQEALHLTARIAEALHHAHERGIVHRDIKPANIMVLANGEPKIMDFGIAKLPASQLTLAGQFFGTPAYMSPEQAAGDEIDGRSDLFSLGSILYLLLTGQRAFDGGSIPLIVSNVQVLDPPAPSALVAGIPPQVDYIVRRALAKRPADRYPDGRSLAEDAEDVRAGREPRHRAGWAEPAAAKSASQASATSGTRRPSFWRLAALSGIGVAVLLALVGVGVRKGAGRGESADHATTASPATHAAAEAEGPVPRTTPTAEAPPPRVAKAAPTRTRSAATRQRPARPVPRAGLRIALAHPLQRGHVRVWIDEEIVLDGALTRRAGRRLLAFGLRGGGYSRTLAVDPGLHVVRMDIESGDDSWTESLPGQFTSGTALRLDASLHGLLKRRLSLEWGSRPRS